MTRRVDGVGGEIVDGTVQTVPGRDGKLEGERTKMVEG